MSHLASEWTCLEYSSDFDHGTRTSILRFGDAYRLTDQYTWYKVRILCYLDFARRRGAYLQPFGLVVSPRKAGTALDLNGSGA
jgi:hypothetical protein